MRPFDDIGQHSGDRIQHNAGSGRHHDFHILRHSDRKLRHRLDKHKPQFQIDVPLAVNTGYRYQHSRGNAEYIAPSSAPCRCLGRLSRNFRSPASSANRLQYIQQHGDEIELQSWLAPNGC